jgi:hypothetical protein
MKIPPLNSRAKRKIYFCSSFALVARVALFRAYPKIPSGEEKACDALTRGFSEPYNKFWDMLFIINFAIG